MSTYEIRSCRLADLRRLAMTLRDADRAEIAAAGIVPRHLLASLWRRTVDPRVGIIDGEVAAAWGDAGDMLSDIGAAWFFTAPPIERMPLAFLREARREVDRMLKRRRILAADVHRDYCRAQRFFRLVGFRVAEPDDRGWCRMTIGA